MVTAPILSYPNDFDIFVLDTDASNHAIGAILSQVQDDVEPVVCYGSYVLILFIRLQVLTPSRSQQPDMAFVFQIPGRTIG